MLIFRFVTFAFAFPALGLFFPLGFIGWEGVLLRNSWGLPLVVYMVAPAADSFDTNMVAPLGAAVNLPIY